MDVKFINTTRAKVNNVAIKNGQIIALSDYSLMYYDLGGVRRPIYPTASSQIVGGVLLSDNYSESAGTADSGVAASSYALVSAFQNIMNRISWQFEVVELTDFDAAYLDNNGKLRIAWGIPTIDGAYEAGLHIQIGWVALQFKIGAVNFVKYRARYGENGWCSWRDL